MGVANEVDRAGNLVVFAGFERRELLFFAARGALVSAVLVVLTWGAVAFTGDLKGVLKGDRKGLESVCDAASILRRFAAGVDILRLC